MYGRWYLPIFLLRDGSLTLIYRASLMVLVRLWSSLPTMSKGVSIVVIDKEEYIKKADELLSQSSYKNISTDPTNRYKNKLITL